VSLLQYGGVADGTTNDADALISALISQNKAVRIPLNTYLSFSINQVPTLIENLDRIYPAELTKFYIPAGEALISANVDISNQFASYIDLEATAFNAQTATAVSKNSGSSGAYAVTYTVPSTADFVIGKYALISAAAGSDKLCRVVEGCFKVTAKTSTTITVLHTLYGSWPTFTLTSATIYPINTVLRWPDNVVGLRIFGTSFRAMRNLVLAGGYDIDYNTPADSACDGLQIGAAPNTPVTGLNESKRS
jgi:hypothetical protein